MNSLSVRLFAAFFAVIVLVIVIISLALLVLLRNSPLVERLALTQLNEAMRGVREAPAAAAPDAALTRYANQLASEYTVRALVVTEDGAVVSDSAPSAPPLRLNLRLARVNAAVPNTRIGRAREGLGEVWLFLARPLGPNRVLVLAEQQAPIPALQFFLDDLLEPLMQAGGVAALVALALSVLIARSVAGPLGKMAHVAQGIAHGNYAQAAPISGPEEVRALGQAINAMAQQVQTTQQAQRDFLANVSHDLKTPLTSIQGFAQAIQEGAAQSPEAIQRSASIIHAEAERMRRLVEGLLDLTKLNTSLSALQRAPLDLRALLASMLDRFALRAQDKGVTLTAELPDQLPSLKGDADRLAQVFGNLIDNALKYTPANGRVVLAAAARPDGVEISVQDNGPGIPPADLGRIFERFYQVEKSRARGVDGGVGLGLAISKEIVEAHGGALTAESVVGLGSKFTVRLPVALPDESTIIRRRKAV